MIEVEIKVKVENKTLLERILQEQGFTKGDLTKESDIYFNSEFYNLKEKDMAFRIRTYENMTSQKRKHVITYKGPKMDHISMTRKELETEVEDANTVREILTSIGYYPVHPVIKNRQYFHNSQMTACLDEVQSLGDFLELEMMVSDDEEKENALEHVIDILKNLGYGKEDIIRTSYLSMLQRKEELCF